MFRSDLRPICVRNGSAAPQSGGSVALSDQVILLPEFFLFRRPAECSRCPVGDRQAVSSGRSGPSRFGLADVFPAPRSPEPLMQQSPRDYSADGEHIASLDRLHDTCDARVAPDRAGGRTAMVVLATGWEQVTRRHCPELLLSVLSAGRRDWMSRHSGGEEEARCVRVAHALCGAHRWSSG